MESLGLRPKTTTSLTSMIDELESSLKKLFVEDAGVKIELAITSDGFVVIGRMLLDGKGRRFDLLLKPLEDSYEVSSDNPFMSKEVIRLDGDGFEVLLNRIVLEFGTLALFSQHGLITEK